MKTREELLAENTQHSGAEWNDALNYHPPTDTVRFVASVLWTAPNSSFRGPSERREFQADQLEEAIRWARSLEGPARRRSCRVAAVNAAGTMTTVWQEN